MKDKPYLGESDAPSLFKYPKCNYCGTDKSVKYEDNSKPYCNRCILIIRREKEDDPEWVGFSNFINNNN